MNIQTRKLNVINYLINLDDEIEFRRIEKEILKNLKSGDQNLRPYTQEELIARVNESMQDYLKGDYQTQDDIEKESENW